MSSKIDSINLRESLKTSYLQCLSNTALELNFITSRINNEMRGYIDYTKNELRTIDDAKDTANNVMNLCIYSKERIRRAKLNFIKTFTYWLKNYVETCDNEKKEQYNVETKGKLNVIELEDSSSSDIEIVNEIKYLKSHKENVVNDKCTPDEESTHQTAFECLNAEENNNGLLLISNAETIVSTNNNKDSDTGRQECNPVVDLNLNYVPEISNDQNKNNDKGDFADECNNSLETLSFDSDSDELSFKTLKERHHTSESSDDSCETSSQNTNCSFDLKNNPYYLSDKKLRMKCLVLLENISNPLQNKHRITSLDLKKLKDREFERLINLSALESKKNKRQFISSSDSSCSNTTGSSSKTKSSHKEKRKKKKFKALSDSEISSFYTSSDDNSSDHNCDTRSNYSDIYEFNKNIFEENEEKLKQQLLQDESSEDYDADVDNDDNDNVFSEDEQTKKRKRIIVRSDSDSSSGISETNKKSKWLHDDLLRFKLSDSKCNKKEKDNENSSIIIEDLPSTSDNIVESKNSKKKKRRRIIRVNYVPSDNSSSDHSSSEDCQIENRDSQISANSCMITDAELLNGHKSGSKPSGRRNIRKLLEDQQITEDTKQAGRTEENRLQRLTERKQKLTELFNGETSQEKEKLILDFDIETRKELIVVDKNLVRCLKPHQKEGVRFMWDSCFETVDRAKYTDGSGCILAHCMGLGKTFQIVTLVHTLLTHKETGLKTVMVVCPMNTVINWLDEFEMWTKNVKIKIKVYDLLQSKKPSSRLAQLTNWHESGGVLIVSYEMFRTVTSNNRKLSPIQAKRMNSYLMNPGADLIVCDEGHLLKNEQSVLANKMQEIRTKRRIILTGTPLQNNLSEYHCMVQFVKPNLLGTKEEFHNRFSNPITNGQFDNSTPGDVKLMKHRAHVLHRMLEGSVQRCDYTVLTPFLPPKQEYVISIRLSQLQIEMYKFYIENIPKKAVKYSKSLFKNYNEIKQLVAHPKTMHLKALKRRESLRDSSNNRNNINDENFSDPWWSAFVKDNHLEDINISYKLILLFGILERCEKEGDKVLIFSQCLYTLDVIQLFLEKFNSDTEMNKTNSLFKFQGQWKFNFDYFRLDGNVNSNKRNIACKTFNDPSNKRARLFLISTRAGGLGINLTGANRVIVFDPSWNPSNDVQSIFRIFRFGQKKPCYIYRFLSAGTMEEKIYNRQVTKLSLSLRVLDEQQIERHYRDSDLSELYKFDPLIGDTPTLSLPRDRVLADVFFKYKDYVYKFFEHDSLLENKEEEELDDDERKQAWFEYQQEKLQQQNTGKINQRKRTIDKNVENKSNENDTNSDDNFEHEYEMGPVAADDFYNINFSKGIVSPEDTGIDKILRT